jgi:glucose/arabinose dehydrogenase
LTAALCALAAAVALSAQATAAWAAPPNPETEPPNRPETPAFAGQTRAPGVTSATRYQVLTVARGLVHPWGLAFLPDGRLLVTERPGRMRLVTQKGAVSAPVAGVPKVLTGDQHGLFGLALSPGFAKDRMIVFAYSEPTRGGSRLAVARAQLAEAAGKASLQDLKVIFRAEPVRSGPANIGGRVVFAPDGTLFVTVGDRFQSRDMAQTLDNDLGKMVRITADGGVPKDNPFVGKAGARPEIWSYGERNGEAAAINPWSHKLWVVEHGPRGGDEINVPLAGRNYGWPVIGYGEDYSGALINGGRTQAPGMEQPIYYWDPVIAPSGMAFYTGDLFPAWKGDLFVGGLASERVSRLTLNGERITGEEWLFHELGERIRDVVQGPDGALWLLTDNDKGRVLKVVPR